MVSQLRRFAEDLIFRFLVNGRVNGLLQTANASRFAFKADSQFANSLRFRVSDQSFYVAF